jgi:hypothetical protein
MLGSFEIMNQAGWVQDQTTKQARAILVVIETRAGHKVYLRRWASESGVSKLGTGPFLGLSINLQILAKEIPSLSSSRFQYLGLSRWLETFIVATATASVNYIGLEV